MPEPKHHAVPSPERLSAWLRRMRNQRVAVVGDAMLDEFLWGDATRISPEAPVPVVLLERQSSSLGGAANVAANVAALGGRPVLFAVTGEDAAGAQLRDLVKAAGIEVGSLAMLKDRPTTVKHRIFARSKHVLRFDRETTTALEPAATAALLRALRAAGDFDALIVSDYAKGCVTPALARGVARMCQDRGLPWCVDPKLPTIRYRGATVVKPNQLELTALTGLPAHSTEELRRAAAKALRDQGCRHLLVTRGARGMALYSAGAGAAAPGEVLLGGGAQAVADVTGAGDTVSAALGLGLAAGLSALQAAQVASLAAAHVVAQPGTAVACARDLLPSGYD